MALYIVLPVASANSQVIGGAYVFETSTTYTSSDIGSHIGTEPSTIDTGIPDVGWTTDQVATSDWEYPANSGQATNLRTFRVTSIGSNTSPTVSDLIQHPLITEYFHSTHSNSLKNDGNGAFLNSRGNYSFDATNLVFQITGEDNVGLDQYASSYNASETIGDWHRTPTNDRGNIYFNGILLDSQSSQQDDETSGNEDYETIYWKTSNNPSTEMASLISDVDITDILMNTEDIPRTDLMFVENVLKNSTGISDEIKLALSFLLAYAKSNQADTKRLTHNFNKTRAVMNITSLQTLENTYRKG